MIPTGPLANPTSLFIPCRESPVMALEEQGRVLDPLLRVLLKERSRGRRTIAKAAGSSLRRLLEACGGHLAALSLSAPGKESGDEGAPIIEAIAPPGSELGPEQLATLVERLSSSKDAVELARVLTETSAGDHTKPLRLLGDIHSATGRLALAGAEDCAEPVERCLENLGSCLDRALAPDAPPLDDIERAYLLARLARLPFQRLGDGVELDPVLLRSLGAERIRDLGTVPLRAELDGLVIALTDPLDTERVRAFELSTGRQVKSRVVIPARDLERVVANLDGLSTDSGARSAVLRQYAEVRSAAPETMEDTPIARLVVELVGRAYLGGASDIHIEPQRDALIVRFRIDGICRVVDRLPRSVHAALLNRLKVMAGLDITEHRLPQDGRVVFRDFCPDMDIGLRVAIAPMCYGESLVLRLIDRSGTTLPMESLGFSEHGLKTYREWLARPHGMIIHAGPTGSGKSISLFAALASLQSPRIKIVTAEDPIEYTLEGINQLEVRPKAGLGFLSALRSFVRMDPDVILLGEMRDSETAEVAFSASLAGPRLLTSVHATDSLATIPRLRRLGVDTYHIAYALRGVCAQRLLRRLCLCRKAVRPSDIERALLGRFGLDLGLDAEATVYEPGACEVCDFSGYKGRIGAYELLTCHGEVQRLIARDADIATIERAILDTGFVSLLEAALAHVVSGVTSFEEVARVIGLQ